MAQFARPVSDISAGGWTTTPLWSKVDEEVRDDSDLITSDNNTSPDTAELALSAVTDPQSSDSHVVRYAYRKNETLGHAINLTVRLMEGATKIASWTHNDIIGLTWEEAAQTLTAAQADAITDYSNLSIQLVRGGDTGGSPNGRRSAQVSWVEFETPDAPAAVDSQGQISFAELSVPSADRTAHISWAELSVPNEPSKAQISWAELSVPDSDRAAHISHAVLSTPDPPSTDRAASISFAELSTPDTPSTDRALHLSNAFLQTPNEPGGESKPKHKKIWAPGMQVTSGGS